MKIMHKVLGLLWLCSALSIWVLAGSTARAQDAALVVSPSEHTSTPPTSGTEEASIPMQTITCAAGLCVDPTCCVARCKCNGYKSGKCQKVDGITASCLCTNDFYKWSTAPLQCK
jgi:hypothetical protein